MGQLRGFATTKRKNIIAPAKFLPFFDATVQRYREAVAFFLAVIQSEQAVLDSQNWLLEIEKLTIKNKNNPNPKCDFAATFGKYPSGWRRAAIAEAFGSASSWRTRYRKWQEKRQKHAEKNALRAANGKKEIAFSEHPSLYPETCDSWLCYYATEYEWLDERHILLKLFTGNSYVKAKIALAQPCKSAGAYQMGSPTLVKKKSGWELHVPMVLPKKEAGLQKLDERLRDPNFRMCCVDLGINHHAAMTVQDAEGRVFATKFISGAKDNRLRKSRLEQIVRLQKQTQVIPEGERFAADLWGKISNFNDYIAHSVSKQIVEFAEKHGCKTIVFEHLASLRPQKGTKSAWLNQKFMFWVKGRVVKYAKYKALHKGIVVNRVSPKNTSRRCPYCGFLSIVRYAQGAKYGVSLSHCLCCKAHDVNSDFVGSLGVGTNFRVKHMR